jgi:hypothetical protein
MARSVTCQVDFDGLSTKDAERRRMSDYKQPAIFIAGSLGLDFLNTLATPVDELVDWIDDGDGLFAWLEPTEGVTAGRSPDYQLQVEPAQLFVDCGYPARTNSAVVRSNFVTCESARIECFEDASRQVQREEPNRDNSDFDCCELLASRRRIP